MRTLWLALCAVALSACNLVYSEKPLFGSGDARGAPSFKPGVWIQDKAGCDIVPAPAPLRDCADPLVIAESELRPPPGAPTDRNGEPQRLPYLLAKGDPRVMQVRVEIDKDEVMWLYQGVRPLRLDERGRIVEARLWPALCGPPPPKTERASGEPAYVTKHPLPGLETRVESCLARAAGPVRNAVMASEAWDKEPTLIRWLREGAQ